MWGPFTTVDTGDRGLTCAVRDDGDISCWFEPWVDRDDRSDSIPSNVKGSFQSVAVGTAHVCATTTEREAMCWGDDAYGQLHPPDAEYEALSAWGDSTCGLTVDDQIVCWGRRGWVIYGG